VTLCTKKQKFPFSYYWFGKIGVIPTSPGNPDFFYFKAKNMERTKFPSVSNPSQISQNKQSVEQEKIPFSLPYHIQDEPLVLSKNLLDLLLKQENPADLISLYVFYYYTAKWQHTHKIRATTAFTATGLHWTEVRVRKIKSQLISLKLVRDVVQKSEDGKILGH